MSRFQSVEEYKAWIDSLPPEAFQPQNGADTLVTYSGRSGENHKLAQQAVADDPDNKYSIEQTPAGEALDQDKLWEPGSPLSEAEAKEVWRHASEKTMEHAQASKMETYAVDAKHDGIFRGTELHTALSNPNIKTINDVPCQQHIDQMFVDDRGPAGVQDSVAKSELARDEKRAADVHDPATRESLQLDARNAEHETWQQQGDKFTPERQEMQDKADASLLKNKADRGGSGPDQGYSNSSSALSPPPPELPPPPPPKPPSSHEQSHSR